MLGFLGIYKPSGIESNKLLGKVKYYLKSHNKNLSVGHMGTLDPDAEGVLVIAVGKATRLFNYFLNKDKTYLTIFKFGLETDTLDASGKTIKKTIVLPSKAQIMKKIPQFIGKIMQKPPAFSAVRINGERAYNLARSGKSFELSAKPIEIKELNLIKQISESEFLFKVKCSSGTYIRSLARDMAEASGSLAITTKIERIESGYFNKENCIKFEDLNYEKIVNNVISPVTVLNYISVININNVQYKNLLDGKILHIEKPDGFYFVISADNDIMLTSVTEKKMKIAVNLKENYG